MNESILQIILWVGFFFLISLVMYVYKAYSKKKIFLYKSKGPYLLNTSEKEFFDVLSLSISEYEYICPKVRVVDLIEVNLPKSDRRYWASFNKISKKHVDFVVCSRSDFAPILVIELDGGSHNTQIRKQRDVFVDDVFAQANIPILHIPVRDNYDQKVICNEVEIAMNREA